MPTYEVEQYELHVQRYRVEAADESQAIVRLLDGEAEPINNTLEFIEVAADYGLAVDEHWELAENLMSLGVPVDEHVVPSIRGVMEAS